MIHFVNPADHIAATNAAIVKAREVSEFLKSLKTELEWLSNNQAASAAPATDEQIHHYWLEVNATRGNKEGDIFLAWFRIAQEHEPRYQNKALHEEFDKREKAIEPLLESLNYAYRDLKQLMAGINAGGKWDFLPLEEFWSGDDEETMFERIDAAIQCVDDAERKAGIEKQATIESPVDGHQKAFDPAEELEKVMPQLDTNNGQWIKNTVAARLEGVETETLGTYRGSGITSRDKMFGKDEDGRIWRRTGTPNSHPWYLRSSLKSVRNPG